MADETKEIVRLSVADGSEAVISRDDLERVFRENFPLTSQSVLTDFDAGQTVRLALARYFWREVKEAA